MQREEKENYSANTVSSNFIDHVMFCVDHINCSFFRLTRDAQSALSVCCTAGQDGVDPLWAWWSDAADHLCSLVGFSC